MSLYQINIEDKAIVEQINDVLNQVLKREIGNKYSVTGREISALVKELVYSRKDEIIERVVDRATREIVKKGLPRLLDSLKEVGMNND